MGSSPISPGFMAFLFNELLKIIIGNKIAFCFFMPVQWAILMAWSLSLCPTFTGCFLFTIDHLFKSACGAGSIKRRGVASPATPCFWWFSKCLWIQIGASFLNRFRFFNRHTMCVRIRIVANARSQPGYFSTGGSSSNFLRYTGQNYYVAFYAWAQCVWNADLWVWKYLLRWWNAEIV